MATDIGNKVTRGKQTKDLSIICSVARKHPLAQLAAGDHVPETKQGMPVDVVETGLIRALLLAAALALSAAAEGGQMASIEQVKAVHESRLLALPGVVSVGIGRDPAGHTVIVVGLDRARTDTQSKIPAALDGYPVRVEIVGTIRAR